MKKIISITLIAVLAFSIVGCQKKGPEPIVDPIKEDGDDALVVNPFKEVETMEEAEKLAGFKMVLPEDLPEDTTQNYIEVAEKEMIQVNYNNKEKNILIRKAKSSEDISGDYNEYENTKEITVGNKKVTVKGNGENLSLATWTEGDFAYSVGVVYESWAPGNISAEDMGIEENVMIELIKSVE